MQSGLYFFCHNIHKYYQKHFGSFNMCKSVTLECAVALHDWDALIATIIPSVYLPQNPVCRVT